MNAKKLTQIVEAMIYLFLYNLHDCTFIPTFILDSKYMNEFEKTEMMKYISKF